MKQPSSVEKLIAESDRCVACGLCVPQCPSYQATGSEVDSPRGRIFIMRAMLEGSLRADAGSAASLDRCLGCGQCEQSCPNSVKFGELLQGARRELSLRNPSRMARMVARIAGRAPLIRLAGLVMPFLRTRAGRTLLRGPLAALNLPTMHPASPTPSIWGEHCARSARGKAHIFVGCFSRLLDSETISAAIKMTNACGYDAIVPRGQACCGSLARQLGDHAEADRLREINRKAFSGADRVLFSASGCREGVGEPGADICAFVREHGQSLRFRPSGVNVLLHEPCSARNSPLRPPAAELLERVPETEVVRVRNTMSCCGAAGSYHIHSPEIAHKLQASMVEDILRVAGAGRPLRLITGNYGCGLFLREGLEKKGIDLAVQHPVSFIADHLTE